MTDLISRQAALDAVLKARLASGPISTWVYDLIKDIPSVSSEGIPTTDGLYAVEVYHGWKLLEWRDGEWWHPDCVGRWTACEPLQWVGPLPPRIGGKSKQEFDL